MKILFVTGNLAAPLLRDTLERMQAGFDYEVAVLGISVAALMTTDWVSRFLEVPEGVDLILLPGHTQGEVDLLKFARLDLQLAKLPFGEGPLVIERIDLRDPQIHFVITEQGLLGMASFPATQQAAPQPQPPAPSCPARSHPAPGRHWHEHPCPCL